ncbi:MAG: PHB depolymerase family esterase [Rhodobacteraceae bacterium]|nr:PHB depolymerase family esterase [Paracoccaceae bacterium]
MNTPFARGLAKATELTKSGNLKEATALIQSLLRPAPEAAARPMADADDVIEGTATRIDDPAAKPTQPVEANAPRAARMGLGATLRGLAERALARSAGSVAPPDVPRGAQFLSLSHRSAHGIRDYRLYVPASHRADVPMPLVVMLHGCTQSPEDFATGTGLNALAEEYGCLVAWPQQPSSANVNKCWNWFQAEDQAEGRGEPALLAGIVTDILRSHCADPARVYVAGLSAGGASAAIMGAAYPRIFAAVGVHPGLPVGGATDIPSAFAAMRSGSTGTVQKTAVPTIVFHGLDDTTVHPKNGEAVVTQALQATPGLRPVRRSGVSGMGRKYRQTRHLDAFDRSVVEHWEIEGAGHAWSGGMPGGSFTDPKGPAASREMMRFFLQHRQGVLPPQA